MKKQGAFIHEEGITYQSQAFYGGEENAGEKGKERKETTKEAKGKGEAEKRISHQEMTLIICN